MYDILLSISMHFFLYLILVNVFSFTVSGLDKHFAKNKKRRIPEKILILFSIIGGGIGTLIAFYLFRHKTRHYKLLFIIWFFTIIEILGIIYFIYYISSGK